MCRWRPCLPSPCTGRCCITAADRLPSGTAFHPIRGISSPAAVALKTAEIYAARPSGSKWPRKAANATPHSGSSPALGITPWSERPSVSASSAPSSSLRRQGLQAVFPARLATASARAAVLFAERRPDVRFLPGRRFGRPPLVITPAEIDEAVRRLGRRSIATLDWWSRAPASSVTAVIRKPN